MKSEHGEHHEVIVLGSGIGGSTVAAILARAGVNVAIVDSARHPRFALGESTIGETSFLLRLLAVEYGVPELAHVSTPRGISEHIGKHCGIKTNFGFVYHRPGDEQDPYEVTQCSVSEGPFGSESHLLRSATDKYLFEASVRYGVTAYEGIRIAEIDVDLDGARVVLADSTRLSADYIIDATGRNSVLAQRYGLRDEPTRCATSTRTLFTHLRGVRPFDEVNGSSGQPNKWHEGTLHHLFDGGWVWVIPFDNAPESENDLVSVGLSLDADVDWIDASLSAEQQWEQFLHRFPTIAKQFAGATAAFPWVETGRTQFSSRQTVGDRWVLMSHAAGAIDALFSRGMANTMSVIHAFVPMFLAARSEKDYSASRFADIERLNQNILDTNDALVHGSYISFRHFDMWRAWSKMWYLAWNLGVIRIAGTFYRFVETGDESVLADLRKIGPQAGTFCPEMESVQHQFDACYSVMLAYKRGEIRVVDAVSKLAFLLGDGPASPEPLNLHDVLRRWHDGSAETQRMIYQWGRTSGPNELRSYFDYDRSTIQKAADEVLTC